MRFRITREICVDVDSIERVSELEALAGEAVLEAVGDAHIPDDDGAIDGSMIEPLDDAATKALGELEED